MICVLSCRNLVSYPTTLLESPGPSHGAEGQYRRGSQTTPFDEIIPIFVGLALLFGGIVQPNVLSSVYFLTFLILGICWAFHMSDQIHKSVAYGCIRVILTAYSGLHVLLLYIYQFPFFQHILNPEDFKSRLLGLPAIINLIK